MVRPTAVLPLLFLQELDAGVNRVQHVFGHDSAVLGRSGGRASPSPANTHTAAKNRENMIRCPRSLHLVRYRYHNTRPGSDDRVTLLEPESTDRITWSASFHRRREVGRLSPGRRTLRAAQSLDEVDVGQVQKSVPEIFFVPTPGSDR